MTRPRLLLVPSFTELEWAIRERLEEWADVASFDMPGVGSHELPGEVAATLPDLDLDAWRRACVDRSLAVLDELGWDRCTVVSDGQGKLTAARLARARPGAVQALALGHASVSNSMSGERPAMNREIWSAFTQLTRQGTEAFVKYGIAQMTRGGTDAATAQAMMERFPDMDVVAAMTEALAHDTESLQDSLAGVDVPLLLAKHEGCLAWTDEGWEDAIAAFPRARTVICPEQCAASPAFAAAIRKLVEATGA